MRAGSVVALWSEHSVGSEWVRNEAAAAADRGVLVPALIDPVQLPLEFRRRQTADLLGWNGDPDHPGFQALCAGLAAALGAPRSPAATKPVRRPFILDLGQHAPTLSFNPPTPSPTRARSWNKGTERPPPAMVSKSRRQ